MTLQPLCLIGRHGWRRMKWGNGRLDCRECARCSRFEIVAYGNWHRVNRSEFPDAREAA